MLVKINTAYIGVHTSVRKWISAPEWKYADAEMAAGDSQLLAEGLEPTPQHQSPNLATAAQVKFLAVDSGSEMLRNRLCSPGCSQHSAMLSPCCGR